MGKQGNVFSDNRWLVVRESLHRAVHALGKLVLELERMDRPDDNVFWFKEILTLAPNENDREVARIVGEKILNCQAIMQCLGFWVKKSMEGNRFLCLEQTSVPIRATTENICRGSWQAMEEHCVIGRELEQGANGTTLKSWYFHWQLVLGAHQQRIGLVLGRHVQLQECLLEVEHLGHV